MTKHELIDTVWKMDEPKNEEACSHSMLRYLIDARERLEALVSFVAASELRHSCARANVYSDDEKNLPPIRPPAQAELPTCSAANVTQGMHYQLPELDLPAKTATRRRVDRGAASLGRPETGRL